RWQVGQNRLRRNYTMHVLSRSLAAAAMLLIGAATAGQAAQSDRTPEAKLAKAIEGRQAGKPVDCLQLRDIRSSEIIDGKALVYRTTNGTVYINTPRSGASSLRWGNILVTDTRSSQLCSIDIVRLYDQASRFQTGFVG